MIVKCDYCGNEYRLKKSAFERRKRHFCSRPCEVCGNPNTEAHHDDYSKPLEVRWLCFKHHRAWHKVHDNPEFMEDK